MVDFTTFWNTYPADLCHGARNKGGKAQAEKAWDKHVKDPDMVLEALRAQIRYDKDAKGKGEFVARWPMASTWLNQKKWDCEIDSHAELQQRHEVKNCQCGNPTHGPRFDKCGECMDYNYDHMRDYYKRHPEIHGLKGRDAVNWIKKQMMEIGK